MLPMTTLAHVHAMLPGSQLINISESEARLLNITRVGSDSRQINEGELFIALTGERFDAHDFLPDVAKAGASAVLVSKGERCPANLAAVSVVDTRVSLGALAKAWRMEHSIPVALVTGSNGKTTVKEMIAAIFRAAVGDAHTLVTKGNLNNEIGLPLTLLRMRPTDRLAVIELGMNHPGETAQLADLAQANIVLINNAQREHQEFMATVAAVAEEHADALRALPEDGVAAFPADSEFSGVWRKAAANRKIIDFVLSANQKAAVTGRLLTNGHVEISTAIGVVEVQLKTLGNHNVRNALAASAVALAANISLENIKVGLESFDPVNGRMQAKHLDANCTIIDDSYNANPDSARAAIDALAQSENPAWFVLGDMGEVGDQGPVFHYEIGVYAAQQGIEKFFAIGEQSQQAVKGFNELKKSRQLSSSAEHFSEIDRLNSQLANDLLLRQKTSGKHLNILIKGSRFMRMERVVQALLEGAKVCS